MSDSPVLHERLDDGIEIVRLNRPHRRNALDSAALGALVALLDGLVSDDDLRVLVLSTTDVRAFCAGADVAEELDETAAYARMADFTRLYALLDAFPVPVITVCVGNCVGAGAEIAAGSDLRVGGDNLRLAWAGSRHGVPVGPARLSPLIGVARAKDLVLTGRTVGAEEALALGLLTRAVAVDDAEAAALELARTVAAQSPEGVRVLLEMFRDLDGSRERVAHENELLLKFQQDGAGLPQLRRS